MEVIMAQWPENWAGDVSADELKERKKITCFKAPERMFLPVLIDLYNGTGEVVGEAGPLLDVVREGVSRRLIGQIMMRAIVADHESVVRFEMDSRTYA
jgi:hypothetical protein